MSKMRLFAALGAAALGVATLFPTLASATVAVVPHSALLYGPSLSGGASSPEALALQSQGWTTNVVSGSAWDAMTQSQFASYQLLVIGDPTCSGGSYLNAAISNEATWSPTLNGNVLMAGNDPVYHYLYDNNNNIDSSGPLSMIQQGLEWAGLKLRMTGLYLSLSCNYGNYQSNAITNGVENGFSVSDTGEGDQDNVVYPTVVGATDLNLTINDLSGWNSSVHEKFTNWPGDFAPMAIMQSSDEGCDVSVGSVTGCPVIVGRGSGVAPLLPIGTGATTPQNLKVTRKGGTVTGTWLPQPGSWFLCTLLRGQTVTGVTARVYLPTCTFRGLNAGGSYGIRVQAQNAAGVSPIAQAMAPAPVPVSIRCKMGKKVKVVTNYAPICPVGYHRI